VLALVFAVGCGDDHLDEAAGIQQGTGYSIVVPEGWGRIDSEATSDIEDSVNDGLGEDLGAPTQVDADMLFAPQEGNRGSNVGIVIEPVPQGMGLTDYSRLTVINGEKLGGEFGPMRPVQLGGDPAIRFAYTLDDFPRLEFEGVASLRADRAVIVTYTADKDHFDERFDQFEGMLRSLNWAD
jgi:hypothetical protein